MLLAGLLVAMAAAADSAGPAVIGYVVQPLVMDSLPWRSGLTTRCPCKRGEIKQGEPDTFTEVVAIELGRRLLGAAAEARSFGTFAQLAASAASGRLRPCRSGRSSRHISSRRKRCFVPNNERLGQVSAGVTAIERPAQGLVPGVYDELVAVRFPKRCPAACLTASLTLHPWGTGYRTKGPSGRPSI